MDKISNIRLTLNSLMLLMIPLASLSQSDNPLPVIDTIKSASDSSRHSFYAGLGYGSNMIYLGSTISDNQAFGYTALSYAFKNEFFISASAFNLSNLEPFLAFYNFSLNYSHVFNSWLDISGGVYRYQVNHKLNNTLFNNFTYSDITLGIDWKLIYSKISYGGILNENPQTYLQVKNSRYFQTPGFFNDKAFIAFDPYVNLLFGTMIKTETTTGTTVITSTQYSFSPMSSNITRKGIINSGSGSGLQSGYGAASNTGSGSGSSVTTTSTTSTTTNTIPTSTTSYKNSFELIEIEFGLPVSFNLNFMTIEAEAGYMLPFYSDLNFPGPKGFIFLISGFFRIF